MIVDCYTHTWESTDKLGRALKDASTNGMESRLMAGASRHKVASDPVHATFVLAFKSHYLDAELSNDSVAAYVSSHADRMIGIASVDPSEPREAIDEISRVREELDMRGVAIAPAAQDFHPTNSQAMLVYAEAAKLGMPIIFHMGLELIAASKLEYAQPVLLDEVARELPGLKIVIAHLGYPWVHETMSLLAKHPNVFAEMSWLLNKPWHTYQAMVSAYEREVMHKLLFGSGFPMMPALHAIEALYSINQVAQGTDLPVIPREQLRGIVERDALSLLGIDSRIAPPQAADMLFEEIPDEAFEEI